MLTHRLRRWPNSVPTLGERLVFAGRTRPDPWTRGDPGVTWSSPDHTVTQIHTIDVPVNNHDWVVTNDLVIIHSYRG